MGVQCHFRATDLIAFFAVFLPTILVGGMGAYLAGIWWLGLWVILLTGYFGFIEIRVLCSHCPHYAEAGPTLRCWANHGMPRLWRYRPGPMSISEKIVFLGGLVVCFGYPIPLLLIGAEWFLLVLYLSTLFGFAMTLNRSFCARCMNIACPFNGVDEQVRTDFLGRNPIIAQAWNGFNGRDPE